MIKRLKTRETFKLHLSKRFFFLFFFLDVFRLVTSVGPKKNPLLSSKLPICLILFTDMLLSTLLILAVCRTRVI